MSDIYSDEELTEDSSYNSSNNDVVFKKDIEYFSKDENIILKKILNFHDESTPKVNFKLINVKKNTNIIKLDIIGSKNDKKIHFSVNISIIDLEDIKVKKINYLKPIIYVDSIHSNKIDFLNELNIKF